MTCVSCSHMHFYMLGGLCCKCSSMGLHSIAAPPPPRPPSQQFVSFPLSILIPIHPQDWEVNSARWVKCASHTLKSAVQYTTQKPTVSTMYKRLLKYKHKITVSLLESNCDNSLEKSSTKERSGVCVTIPWKGVGMTSRGCLFKLKNSQINQL